MEHTTLMPQRSAERAADVAGADVGEPVVLVQAAEEKEADEQDPPQSPGRGGVAFAVHADEEESADAIQTATRRHYISSWFHHCKSCDLANVTSFCRFMRDLRSHPRLEKRQLVYYVELDSGFVDTAAFLMAAYLMLCEGFAADEAAAPFARSIELLPSLLSLESRDVAIDMVDAEDASATVVFPSDAQTFMPIHRVSSWCSWSNPAPRTDAPGTCPILKRTWSSSSPILSLLPRSSSGSAGAAGASAAGTCGHLPPLNTASCSSPITGLRRASFSGRNSPVPAEAIGTGVPRS